MLKSIIIAAWFLCFSLVVSAQLGPVNNERITYAVPFLLVSSDARTSSMGDAGAAVLSTATSLGSGLAKNSYLEIKSGFNLTYTPWLTKLIKDRKLVNLDGFYKIGNSAALIGSLNYLSYGQFDLVDENRVGRGSINPAEYITTLGIAKSFGKSFALGTNLKYINSNLYSATDGNATIQSGNGFAVDISSFHSTNVWLFNKASTLAFSINILNIGPKMAYYFNAEQKYFLPTALKVGSALTIGDKNDDEISLAFDIVKLLVPSQTSVMQQPSVLNGMLSSFTDSKDGLSGELREVGFSFGAEYIYKQNLAFRSGYNYRNTTTGLGSFFAMGVGFKHKKAAFDLSYVTGNAQQTFLSNTLRFTLGYSIPK